MFTKSEKYYDAIYETMGKDYAAEAETVHGFIQKHKRTVGNSLLDVACGTATHAATLKRYYKYEGVDLDPAMVKIARTKFPKLKFHQGDMMDFDLGKKFDALICLFSSIGYAKTRPALAKALKTMTRHLLRGGALLIEPWFSPDEWKSASVRAQYAEKPDFKIARMSYTGRRGNISLLDFHYTIGDRQGVRTFVERHEMGLFTHEEYIRAFETAGLKTIHHKKGLDGRGLYIGRKI